MEKMGIPLCNMTVSTARPCNDVTSTGRVESWDVVALTGRRAGGWLAPMRRARSRTREHMGASNHPARRLVHAIKKGTTEANRLPERSWHPLCLQPTGRVPAH